MSKKLIILGNGVDWCEKSLKEISKFDNIYLNNKKIPVNGKFKNKIAKVFFSQKLNRKIKIPFKSFWYRDIKRYIRNHVDIDDELCILIYDHNAFGGEITFLNFLKKEFKNIKLAYIFTNIVGISYASSNNFVEKLNKYYDVVYAFDPDDAIKYNFKYSPLIYSANFIDVLQKKKQAFYVGKAKDRLDMLIEIFERLTKLGIETKYYIFDVPLEKQVYADKIKYNQYLTYEECLKNIQESACLIDVIQSNSSGYTIKNCEAVFYDKLLITTNKKVKDAPFYDERYMLIMDSVDDITKDFFDNAENVKYSNKAKDYFSFDTYLKKLYNDLEINN